jgi:hypothetical protein
MGSRSNGGNGDRGQKIGRSGMRHSFITTFQLLAGNVAQDPKPDTCVKICFINRWFDTDHFVSPND